MEASQTTSRNLQRKVDIAHILNIRQTYSINKRCNTSRTQHIFVQDNADTWEIITFLRIY